MSSVAQADPDRNGDGVADVWTARAWPWWNG